MIYDKEDRIANCVAGGAALIGLAAYTFSPRVNESHAALKVVWGELVSTQVDHGLKMDAVLPFVDYILLPKSLQKMTVATQPNDYVTVRTKDNSLVCGKFEIHYALDGSHPSFGDIYARLKCNDITDIEPFINNYALPAIIDTYRVVPTAAVNDKLTEIGKTIAEQLQRTLEERGYPYIRIQDVIPSGVWLSPEVNDHFELAHRRFPENPHELRGREFAGPDPRQPRRRRDRGPEPRCGMPPVDGRYRHY
jgi:hypothetical protein